MAHEIARGEWFAPAQFEQLSEADKLSRPGFEQMVGGVAIGATAIRAGTPLVRALDYDTVVVVNGQRQDAPHYRPSIELQLVATQASATARPPRRATGPAAFAPPATNERRSGQRRSGCRSHHIGSTNWLAPVRHLA